MSPDLNHTIYFSWQNFLCSGYWKLKLLHWILTVKIILRTDCWSGSPQTAMCPVQVQRVCQQLLSWSLLEGWAATCKLPVLWSELNNVLAGEGTLSLLPALTRWGSILCTDYIETTAGGWDHTGEDSSVQYTVDMLSGSRSDISLTLEPAASSLSPEPLIWTR